VLHHKQEY